MIVAIPPIEFIQSVNDPAQYKADRIFDTKTLFETRRRPTNASQSQPQDTQALLDYVQQVCTILQQNLLFARDLKSCDSTWVDAFDRKIVVKANNWYLELACCVWNIGSTESILAARIERTNELSIRDAGKKFQKAAGCFQFIESQILPILQNQTQTMPCFTHKALHFVKVLMLAQSQLCFYEQATLDIRQGDISAAVVAQLAQQTSQFYFNSGRYFNKVNPGVINARLFAVAKCQSMCMLAAAEFWQGESCAQQAVISTSSSSFSGGDSSSNSGSESGSGGNKVEAVERYQRAETFAGLAIETAKQAELPRLILGSFLQTVRSRLASATTSVTTSVTTSATTAVATSAIRPAASVVVTEIQGICMVSPTVLLPGLWVSAPRGENTSFCAPGDDRAVLRHHYKDPAPAEEAVPAPAPKKARAGTDVLHTQAFVF